MIKRKLAKLAPFFQSAMVVLIASLFVMTVVYAATTIGSNVNTGGTLTASGLSTFSTVTSTSATSSEYLMVGGAAASYALFNHAGGDLYVKDDVEIDDAVNIAGNSTLVGTLTVTGLSTFGNASTTGDLVVSGGTFSLATGTATTTNGLFVGPTGTTGTTTVGIGDQGQVGCLELTREGAWYRCYINTAKTGIECAAGRCN